MALLQAAGRQPYHDLPDLGPILRAARVAGVHLEPRALLDVASFVEGGVEIARRVARAERAPRLARRAAEVKDASEVAAAIRRAILPSGEVADDATPRLAEIRRGLARLRAQLQSVMESFLRGKEADRVLQDKLVTTRNDRYVLLLKAEHRGQVPGIIHGSSGSGASVFVEPMPAVELNNDIVSLDDEEREEMARILQRADRPRGRARRRPRPRRRRPGRAGRGAGHGPRWPGTWGRSRPRSWTAWSWSCWTPAIRCSCPRSPSGSGCRGARPASRSR